MRASVLVLCFAGMMAASSAAPAPGAAVAVESGKLVGRVENGVRTFLGIPFAAPPVGDLRWKAPQAVKPWKGVRQATAYAPACKQSAEWIPEPKKEDCLYLNVWAPAKADKPLPVMVWIHGGGFYGGSGTQPAFRGERLVRGGVILVTINYRLGVFGFFAHPELSAESPGHASGNQGLLDQVAALRWVKRNIASFGGDPNNVTIFGESAGSESVYLLMGSPLAKGLFHRAIGESGAYGKLADLKTAEGRGSELAAAKGATSLADLRAMPADALVHQPWSPQPNLDGLMLTDQPEAVYAAGKQSAVPLLLGWNAEEGRDLAPEIFATKEFTPSAYPFMVTGLLGHAPSPAFLAAYPVGTDAQGSVFKFTTDWWGWVMWRWAGAQHRVGQPTYLYYFVHSPAEPKTPCGYGCGAGHGAEIRFVFGLEAGERDWSADDLALADRMARYWTNFAKFGDPNGEGVPVWPSFDGQDASILRLGSKAEIETLGQVPDFSLFGP